MCSPFVPTSPQGMFQNGQRSLSFEHLRLYLLRSHIVRHEVLVRKPKVYRHYDFNDPRIIMMLGELPKKKQNILPVKPASKSASLSTLMQQRQKAY